MYSLHYNEETNVFTIVKSGVTITEAYYGRDIMISDNPDYLLGIAHGINSVKSISDPDSIEALKMRLSKPGDVMLKQD